MCSVDITPDCRSQLHARSHVNQTITRIIAVLLSLSLISVATAAFTAATIIREVRHGPDFAE